MSEANPESRTTDLSKKEQRMLKRRICSFCEGSLTIPARGICAAVWKPEGFSDDDCGWVRAIRTLGVTDAIRQSKLPVEQRSAVS